MGSHAASRVWTRVYKEVRIVITLAVISAASHFFFNFLENGQPRDLPSFLGFV